MNLASTTSTKISVPLFDNSPTIYNLGLKFHYFQKQFFLEKKTFDLPTNWI